MKNIKSKVRHHLTNIRGYRTNRKIIVFESDDWGAVRTSSNHALNVLRKNGNKVDNCHYMLYDGLASEHDLSFLFEVLEKYSKKSRNKPVLTANSLIANPDFQRIKESNFKTYHWEHFTETLSKYPYHTNAFQLWTEGINKNIFHPQSHGREHLNVSRWMGELKNGVPDTLLAFNYGIFGVSAHIAKSNRGSYLAAFDAKEGEPCKDRKQIIYEGLKEFQKTFGFPSHSFIAPNYIWDDEIEHALIENGVKYIQGNPVQRITKKNQGSTSIKRHFQGEKNDKGQRYLVRNASFEPSSNPNRDWVDSCLKEISNAFFWHKPAIIGTHRVNYIGFLNPKNRDQNLKSFEKLLYQVINKWPEVEFMTSDQLGELMDGKFMAS